MNLLYETAYCDQCKQIHWIEEVISDTQVKRFADDWGHNRTPEGTRRRHVRFECGNESNVISRHVSGRV